MQTYFNIRYEFDKELVGTRIAQQVTKKEADYICVADGVILNVANRNSNYLKIVNGECSLFVIAVMSHCIFAGFTESGMSNIAEAKSSWILSAARSTG